MIIKYTHRWDIFIPSVGVLYDKPILKWILKFVHRLSDSFLEVMRIEMVGEWFDNYDISQTGKLGGI